MLDKLVLELCLIMNHFMDIKIYYEDTDCGGVVYYANYMKYMERARTEYLADKGYSVKQLAHEGTIFMVLRAEIDYKSPARYGDVIEIETWVSEASRITITFEHIMREKSTKRLLTECKAKLVYVDPDGRPRRLPEEYIQTFK
jgi:acyl-CoA thioester hydrolase